MQYKIPLDLAASAVAGMALVAALTNARDQ